MKDLSGLMKQAQAMQQKLADVAERYGKLFAQIDGEYQEQLKQALKV